MRAVSQTKIFQTLRVSHRGREKTATTEVWPEGVEHPGAGEVQTPDHQHPGAPPQTGQEEERDGATETDRAGEREKADHRPGPALSYSRQLRHAQGGRQQSG